MFLEPLRQSVGGAIRQEGHGLAAFEINEHGAIGLAFPQGKIVPPEHSGRGARRDGQPQEQAEQGVPAHHQVPLVAELYPSRAPQRQGNSRQTLGEP
jgi:hypothetical protein